MTYAYLHVQHNPVHSNGQHLSSDNCLQGRLSELFHAVLCTTIVHSYKHTHTRPLSRIFQKIRLAEPYFQLISGLAEFLRKLRNSVENTPEHHKFGQRDRQIETIKFKI